MINVSLQVRRAVPGDYPQIASLMSVESNTHRHLDWRSPLDWIGSPHYWVLKDGERICAAFACPEDPPQVMWIRLFVHLPQCSAPDAWHALWDTARPEIPHAGGHQVGAIIIKQWFQTLLLSSGFQFKQDIILLELKGEHFKPFSTPRGITIRPMHEADLQGVSVLDLDAFGSFWHNSYDMLQRAFVQSVYASVAEDQSGMIGYQLSTGNPYGAHLARLGVRQEAQGRGIGAALVSDLVGNLDAAHLTRLTVNTQSDNGASLTLYHKMGFARTGEHFPVLVYPGG